MNRQEKINASRLLRHKYLIALVEDGWINQEVLCQEYGWEPTDPASVRRYRLTNLLKSLRQGVRILLFYAKQTPLDQTLSEPIQDYLLAFFRPEVMQVSRALVGLSRRHQVRMQALISRKETIDREQDDRILRLVVRNLAAMKHIFDQVALKHSTNQ